MSLLKDVLGGVFDWVGNTIEEASRNPLETLLTMGINKHNRNGGRQALHKASWMKAEAAMIAKLDAKKKLAGESMIASIPYASAFGQPNPSLLTQQQSKKTLLGSF